MENNLVRTTNILGNDKNVVGTNTSDLVLEALGKVYIKTGKLTRVLNDVFKLLDGIDKDNVGSKTIITNKLDALKFPGDGFLVFDTNANALYISYDQRYLLVIDGIDKEVKDLGFVKKEGDTMYGPLKITHRGAPLIVASNELVKRFNANYLEGHDSKYFAAKSLDELISGYWTFQLDTKFNENVTIDKNINVGRDSLVLGNSVVLQDLTVKGSAEVYNVAKFRNNVKIDGDVILEGSIGSQMFMSGYLGYGWRFEADTNMLTVDYLVVRKAMHVFELVVNKISATNGSLWVTDSAKIDSVYDVKTLPITGNYIDLIEEDVWYVPYQNTTSLYNRKKIVINESNIKRPELYTTIGGEIVTDNTYYYYDIFKYICKYKSELVDADAKNVENMDKVAVLFPESDFSTGELTHFERNVGFDFSIDGEMPLYVYDNKPSFRRPISYNYYDERGNAVGNNYNKLYAYIKANVFVEATEEELKDSSNTLYQFNSVTKKYIKYESSVPEYAEYKYKYILKNNYLVKVLYYSKERFLEEATHFKPNNCDYFLEATPTHRKNDISPTYNFNEASNTYTLVVDGNYYYDSNALMYKEIEKYVKALPPTHYYDASTGQYKESTYLDENKPEYYLDLETNTYVKGASYVYDKNSGNYVLVQTPTHLLSNYKQAEGLAEATHVYVPESYYAPASGIHIATHKRLEINGVVLWITLDESSVLNSNIQLNKILNTNTTPRIITVDRNLKSITDSDIKYLYALYKYFGIPANDDIWDNETIINLDNVKVIKMKDDEYPPFKEGDILRCQKFENGDIKFYEAVVACKIDAYSYVIIIAGSVFDIQTTIEYNDDGTVKEYKEELNKTLYSKTSLSEGSTEGTAVGKDGFDEDSLISGPAVEDGLVRIGHLYDRDRQNSVYITSSEMDSPYIQTISGVNRPDYTVLYGEPNFITNDRGYYQFSTDSFKIVEGDSDLGTIEVNTPNGVLKLKCKDGKFYAPNNNYINESGNIVIAEYNPNSVKINNNTRVRLGNLNGITDPIFVSKQPYGYGLFADNVFLKGEFYLNNGLSVVEFTKDYINMEVKTQLNVDTNVFDFYTEIDNVWNLLLDVEEFIVNTHSFTLTSKSSAFGVVYRKSKLTYNNWNKIKLKFKLTKYDCVDGANIGLMCYNKNDNKFLDLYSLPFNGDNDLIEFDYKFSLDDVETLNKSDGYLYLYFKAKGTIKVELDIGTVTVTIKDAISKITIDSEGIRQSVQKQNEDLTQEMSRIEQKADNILLGVNSTKKMELFEKSDISNYENFWKLDGASITDPDNNSLILMLGGTIIQKSKYKVSTDKIHFEIFTPLCIKATINIYDVNKNALSLNFYINNINSDGETIKNDFKLNKIPDDYVYLHINSTQAFYFKHESGTIDSFGSKFSSLQVGVDEIKGRVSGLDNKVSLIDLKVGSITMSVGKTYLFKPTVPGASSWHLTTGVNITYDDSLQCFNIINSKNTNVSIYKKSLYKFFAKKGDTLTLDIEKFGELVDEGGSVIGCLVGLVDGIGGLVISGPLYTIKGSKNSVQNITKNITIKLDCNGCDVYLVYKLLPNQTIYFYNDTILYDLGSSTFKMTEDKISLGVTSAVETAEGNITGKLKTTGINILEGKINLTADNTIIESGLLEINTNKVEINNGENNVLKIEENAVPADIDINNMIGIPTTTILSSEIQCDFGGADAVSGIMYPLYKSGASYASSNGNTGYYVSKVANPAQVLYLLYNQVLEHWINLRYFTDFKRLYSKNGTLYTFGYVTSPIQEGYVTRYNTFIYDGDYGYISPNFYYDGGFDVAPEAMIEANYVYRHPVMLLNHIEGMFKFNSGTDELTDLLREFLLTYREKRYWTKNDIDTFKSHVTIYYGISLADYDIHDVQPYETKFVKAPTGYSGYVAANYFKIQIGNAVYYTQSFTACHVDMSFEKIHSDGAYDGPSYAEFINGIYAISNISYSYNGATVNKSTSYGITHGNYNPSYNPYFFVIPCEIDMKVGFTYDFSNPTVNMELLAAGGGKTGIKIVTSNVFVNTIPLNQQEAYSVPYYFLHTINGGKKTKYTPLKNGYVKFYIVGLMRLSEATSEAKDKKIDITSKASIVIKINVSKTTNDNSNNTFMSYSGLYIRSPQAIFYAGMNGLFLSNGTKVFCIEDDGIHIKNLKFTSRKNDDVYIGAAELKIWFDKSSMVVEEGTTSNKVHDFS